MSKAPYHHAVITRAIAHIGETVDPQPRLEDVAAAVGLSGTGRLHDLFLTWEAMSPGEYAAKGKGLSIRWGWFDSPLGPRPHSFRAAMPCAIRQAWRVSLGLAGKTRMLAWEAARYDADDDRQKTA